MEDDPALTVTDLSALLADPRSGGPRAGPLVVLRGDGERFASAGARRLRGRRLLRAAATALWDVAAEPVVTARCPTCGGDHGRPVVSDPPSGRRLTGSVTHAGSATLVALGPTTVGIDAEPLVGDPSRFVAIREVCGRSAADIADGVEALRLWTAIEAVLKADGRGLDVDPRRVSVDGAAGTTGATAWIDDGPRFALRGTVVDGLVVGLAVPVR